LSINPGTLFVVATPIGNLDDISRRALDVLAAVDVVAAEDTRRTGQLLTRLGVRNRLLSLHEHNESARIEGIVNDLVSGRSVALVSDAGTPLISDPGYRLLAAVRQHGLPVSPVPGCCAAIAALSIAGLPGDHFYFEGFLPAKSVARKKRLQVVCTRPETVVCYEAVHRINEVLAELGDIAGPDRPIALAREITKLHESIYRGTVAQVREQLAADPGGDKGEFTLVIGGHSEPSVPGDGELARVLAILLADLPPRQASGLAARITGANRRDAYRLAVELKAGPE
jgi:16S rRNA (cytidine1402-2'-O)-methyltransferase